MSYNHRNFFIIPFLIILCRVSSAQIERVYLVPFSHLDVGYTAPVDSVEILQNSYLDSTIDFIEQTEGWPEGSRFKWTIECWWVLENYIRDRTPEEVSNLISHINAGDIEVGAFYANLFTDLSGPEELIRSIKPPLRIKPKTGMIDDVPGYTWLIPELLAGSDIPYLSVAPNSFLSNFFQETNLPRPFFWEGMDGSRILVWYCTDTLWAYLEGAALGFFSNYETVSNHLPQLLDWLESEGYPYSAIHICCVTGDNGPPSLKPCEIAAEWNENYNSPKIIVSTNSEFFEYMMENHESEMETYSGDASGWWTFIISSCAREGVENMRMIDIIPKVETVSSLATISNENFNYPQDIWDLYRGSLLFSEHTFGAWNIEGSPEMWAEKVSWLTTSLERSNTLIEEAVSAIADEIASSPHSVAVFNTLPFMRDDIASIALDNLGLSGSLFIVIDEETQDTIPSQVEGDTLFFIASSVPSLGYRTYRIEESTKLHEQKDILENPFYRIEIDPTTGGISSIYDRDMERELVSGGECFAEYIYNGTQGPTSVEITPGKNGPVLRSLVVDMNAPGSRGVRSEFTLYDSIKRIDIQITVDKEEATTTESVHFSFPFAFDGEVYYDIPSGIVNLYDDELSGFRTHHYAIQHYIAVLSEGTDCVLASNAPLMRFLSDSPDCDCIVHFVSEGGLYRASTGIIKFHFSITSGEDVSPDKFGYSFSNPLITLPVLGKGGNLSQGEHSFITIDPDCVRLLTLKQSDDDDGYIIRLKNMKADMTSVSIETGFELNSAYLTTLVEENIEPLNVDSNRVDFSILPYAIETIRLIPTSQNTEERPEISWLKVFPNPVLEEVYFISGLPGIIEVYISDLSGRLVYSLRGENPRWLLNDNQGREVPSGIYFYRTKSGLREKTGKLVIIGRR
jgi:hypothetical protein